MGSNRVRLPPFVTVLLVLVTGVLAGGQLLSDGTAGADQTHELAAPASARSGQGSEQARAGTGRPGGAGPVARAQDRVGVARLHPAPPREAVRGLNWPALAQCESRGDPRAVSTAGYFGLYQVSLTAWRSVGGYGNPVRAGVGEQTARAQELYARHGSDLWPVCARYL